MYVNFKTKDEEAAEKAELPDNPNRIVRSLHGA